MVRERDKLALHALALVFECDRLSNEGVASAVALGNSTVEADRRDFRNFFGVFKSSENIGSVVPVTGAREDLLLLLVHEVETLFSRDSCGARSDA